MHGGVGPPNCPPGPEMPPQNPQNIPTNSNFQQQPNYRPPLPPTQQSLPPQQRQLKNLLFLFFNII